MAIFIKVLAVSFGKNLATLRRTSLAWQPTQPSVNIIASVNTFPRSA